MSKISRFINVAKELAERSSHNYKLGAVIYKHGKIVSTGYNKTNRGVNKHYGHWSGSLHAELSAIINARTDLTGASIVVARRYGRLARPCTHCLAAIKEAGIKQVWFTDGLGVDKFKIS